MELYLEDNGSIYRARMSYLYIPQMLIKSCEKLPTLLLDVKSNLLKYMSTELVFVTLRLEFETHITAASISNTYFHLIGYMYIISAIHNP